MTRAGLTPARIVEEAADLADEAGLDSVTPSAVARRVGVQVASLYSHVGGADDLRDRLSALALEELADLADRALAGRAGREALVALGSTYRDYARAHPGRWTAAGRLRPPLGEATIAAGRRHSDLAFAVLRGYDLTGTDQVHAVRFLSATLRGYVDLEAYGGFAQRRPSSRLSWLRTLDALDVALTHWPSS